MKLSRLLKLTLIASGFALAHAQAAPLESLKASRTETHALQLQPPARTLAAACDRQYVTIDDSKHIFTKPILQYKDGVWTDMVWEKVGYDYVIKQYQITAALSTPWSIKSVRYPDTEYAMDIEGPASDIYRLYAVFNRTPDLPGLGYWIKRNNECMTVEQIASSFMSHPEFASIYGSNSSNDYFLTQLYSYVLRRSPDASGYAYWLQALNNGFPRLNLVLAFTGSQELKDRVRKDLAMGITYTVYRGFAASTISPFGATGKP